MIGAPVEAFRKSEMMNRERGGEAKEGGEADRRRRNPPRDLGKLFIAGRRAYGGPRKMTETRLITTTAGQLQGYMAEGGKLVLPMDNSSKYRVESKVLHCNVEIKIH
jgi:hypothetical protein